MKDMERVIKAKQQAAVKDMERVIKAKQQETKKVPFSDASPAEATRRYHEVNMSHGHTKDQQTIYVYGPCRYDGDASVPHHVADFPETAHEHCLKYLEEHVKSMQEASTLQ